MSFRAFSVYTPLSCSKYGNRAIVHLTLFHNAVGIGHILIQLSQDGHAMGRDQDMAAARCPSAACIRWPRLSQVPPPRSSKPTSNLSSVYTPPEKPTVFLPKIYLPEQLGFGHRDIAPTQYIGQGVHCPTAVAGAGGHKGDCPSLPPAPARAVLTRLCWRELLEQLNAQPEDAAAI